MSKKDNGLRVGSGIIKGSSRCPCGSGESFKSCCFKRAKIVRHAVEPFPLGVGIRFKSGVIEGQRLMALELSVVDRQGLTGTQDIQMVLMENADPRMAMCDLLMDAAKEFHKLASEGKAITAEASVRQAMDDMAKYPETIKMDFATGKVVE